MINIGDKVKHKYLLVNGGLAMTVLDKLEDKAQCDFFDGKEMINKQDWFNLEDLEIVIYGDGGFKKAGE